MPTSTRPLPSVYDVRLRAGLALAGLLGLALASCGDGEGPATPPLQPLAAAPSSAVVDGRHPAGNPAFWFLPPLAPAPSYSGVFDPTQPAVVEICPGPTGTPGCAAPVARFERRESGGPSSGLVVTDEAYQVNWRVGDASVSTLTPYRVRVLVEAQVLGEMDVMVFESGRERREIQQQGVAAVPRRGVTPVRFRIEEGAVNAARPDLSVAALSGSPDPVPLGQAFQASVQVTNAGTGAAGAFDVVVWAETSSGDAFGEPVTLRIDGGLAAGASTTVVASGPAAIGLSDPALRIRARVDAAAEVAELDEANNEAETLLAVALPDLVLASLAAPASMIVGEPAQVTLQILNPTGVDAPLSTVAVRLLDAAGAVVVEATTDVAVPGGASLEVALAVTALEGSGDALTVEATADAGGVVPETDETNNRATAAVVLNPNLPDLIVQEVTTTPTLTLGVQAPVTVMLGNTGFVPATDVSYLLEVVDASGAVVATLGTHVAAGEMAPGGGALSHTVQATPDAAWGGPGPYTFRATADPAAAIGELDETNNGGSSAPVTLGAPDLALGSVVTPASAQPGGSLTATVPVGNAGDRDADAFTVEWRVSDGGVEVLTQTDAQAPLAVGASADLTTSFVVDPAWTGPLAITVEVSGVAEFETGNNTASGGPIAIERIDLSAQSAPSHPDALVLACAVPVSVTIANLGNGLAPQSITRFRLLSGDGATEVETRDVATPAIPGGGSVVVEAGFLVGASWPGQVQVEAIANADGALQETDPDNNRSSSQAAPAVVRVAPPAGFTKLWICGSSDAWYDGANWQPAGAPVRSDAVFVPAGVTDAAGAPRNPRLTAGARIADLTIEDGASVALAGFSLAIEGSLVSSFMEGPGTVVLDGAEGRGRIPALLIANASRLSGDLAVDGDATIPYDDHNLLDIDGHTLTVGGRFDLQYNTNLGPGTLRMTVPGSVIDGQGDVVLHLNRTDMSGGTIYVGGDFAQPRGDQNGGRIIFDGTAPQSAWWTHLTDVEVAGGADVTVTANSHMFGRMTVRGRIFQDAAVGQVAFTGLLPRVLGGSYEVGRSVVSGTVTLDEDVTLAHPSATVIVPVRTENLLDVNGHRLVVGGFNMQYDTNLGSGSLRMTVPGSEIDAEGDVVLHLGRTDMPEGTIRVGGNFAQPRGGQDGGTIIFDGTAPQSAWWTHLTNVVVAGGADVTVTQNSHVLGRLTVEGRIHQSAAVGQIAYTGRLPRVLGGSYEVERSAISGTVVLDEDVTLAHPSASVILPYRRSNVLDINGHMLFTGGGFEQQYDSNLGPGQLHMLAAGSEIEAQGNVVLHQGGGEMLEGTIRVGGNFAQPRGSTNGVEVIFDGTAPQTASWVALGDVRVAAGADVTVSGTPTVYGQLTVDGRMAGSALYFRSSLPRIPSGSYEIGTTVVDGHIVLQEDATLPLPTNHLVIPYPPHRTTALDVNGHRVFVGGNLSVGYRTNFGAGRLLMTTPGSELEVDGNVGMDMRGSDVTGGRIRVGGHLSTIRGSYSGTELTFDGTAPQTPSPGAAMHHVRIDNPAGVTLNTASITGQLRSTPGVQGLLTGTGGSLLVRGLAAEDLTLDNRPLVIDGGDFGTTSNLTFRNLSPTITQLTVRHPGAATPLVWTGFDFQTTPTSGFYIHAEDHIADGNHLAIELVGAAAVNGPTFTSTAGAASVIWR